MRFIFRFLFSIREAFPAIYINIRRKLLFFIIFSFCLDAQNRTHRKKRSSSSSKKKIPESTATITRPFSTQTKKIYPSKFPKIHSQKKTHSNPKLCTKKKIKVQASHAPGYSHPRTKLACMYSTAQ